MYYCRKTIGLSITVLQQDKNFLLDITTYFWTFICFPMKKNHFPNRSICLGVYYTRDNTYKDCYIWQEERSQQGAFRTRTVQRSLRYQIKNYNYERVSRRTNNTWNLDVKFTNYQKCQETFKIRCPRSHEKMQLMCHFIINFCVLRVYFSGNGMWTFRFCCFKMHHLH